MEEGFQTNNPHKLSDDNITNNNDNNSNSYIRLFTKISYVTLKNYKINESLVSKEIIAQHGSGRETQKFGPN